MTLMHAGEDHSSVVNVSSALVLLVIDHVGWEASDMKLENLAVASFLEGSEYKTTVLIALSYLLYRSKVNTTDTSSASGPLTNGMTNQRRGMPSMRSGGRVVPMNISEEAQSSFEMLVQKDNFAVLKGLWRWCMGRNKKPKLIALELLSSVSMQENVRAFLVKFEGVSKLIALLPTSSDERAVSAGGDQYGIDLNVVKFIVKTVVNICSTSEKAKTVLRSKLSNMCIGPNKIKMSDLIDRDEAIRFYMGMLK